MPPQVGVAWRHYFLSHFPNLDVICFTSFPNSSASTVPTGKGELAPGREGREKGRDEKGEEREGEMGHVMVT